MQGDNLKNIEQAIQTVAQALKNQSVISSTEVGTIVSFGGATAPAGWILCNGAAVSRIAYADLFGVVGTTYGVGDGSTTFNLPDLRGRVPVGQDTTQTEFDVLGEVGGHKKMQSHTHSPGNVYNVSQNSNGGATSRNLLSLNSSDVNQNMSLATAGTGNAENLQPYQVINYIIRFARPVYSQSSMALADLITANRQNDTTNSVGQFRIETGWGVMAAGGLSQVTDTVVFQKPFVSIPIVVASFGGDHASSTVYGSGGVSLKETKGLWATSITTAQFAVQVRTSDGANWPAGGQVFYQWIAIGS